VRIRGRRRSGRRLLSFVSALSHMRFTGCPFKFEGLFVLLIDRARIPELNSRITDNLGLKNDHYSEIFHTRTSIFGKGEEILIRSVNNCVDLQSIHA